MTQTTASLILATILGYVVSASPDYAQPPSLTDQIAAWQALPEDPAMRQVCMHDLTYATNISALLAKHASIAEIMQWESQEIAQETKQYPIMDPMDIMVGAETAMNALITHDRFDGPIYQHIPGGFPQWSYRSCLRGRN
jgi:hypothetical protein